MKIVFLCHFSNPMVRGKLDLKRYLFRRFLYSLKGGVVMYDDFAIWVSDFIAEFEKHREVEFHIVAPHYGMCREQQTFINNGIHYHFFRWNYGVVQTILNNKFHLEEKNNYKRNREKMKKIIQDISPDIVLLCGAENPYYSIGVLDVEDIPIYVILQTLLNDPKRIEMGVGNPYRRKIELEVFKHANYFCTSGDVVISVIKSVNPNAVFLPVRFPSHKPEIVVPKSKEYDFSFFARTIGKYKGIEDLLYAMALLKSYKSDVSLIVIGGCSEGYKKTLDNIIKELGIIENVHFAGFYNDIRETFENVAKAKAVVVPGITALNSTVRESMNMGLLTICYEVAGVSDINKDKPCLLSAPVGDIDALSQQMLFVLNNPEQSIQIADNGKEYAERVFGNEAIVNKLLEYCCQIVYN